MIISFFKNTNGATGAVNYCLSSRDHTGQLRSVAPEVIFGDPQLTKELDKECAHLTRKHATGVIAFRDNEKPTKEQLKMVTDIFREAYSLDGRANCLLVLHQDKGNFEVHFILNALDLPSGKAFNPFPPGSLHKDFNDALVAVINHKLGYEQIEIKEPFKTKFTSEEKKAFLSKELNGFENLDKKKALDNLCKKLVSNGEVTDRKELVETLKEAGFKISRSGADYISIENKDGRNIRLKGGIYAENESKSYDEVKKNFSHAKPPFNLDKTIKNYERLFAYRNAQYEEKFKTELSKSPDALLAFAKLDTHTRQTVQVEKSPQPLDTPTHREREAYKPSIGARATTSNPVSIAPIASSPPSAPPSFKQAQQAQASQSQSEQFTKGEQLGGFTAEVSTGVISAQMAVDSAAARLSSAKTPEERARAEMALRMAQAQLARAQAENENKKNGVRI